MKHNRLFLTLLSILLLVVSACDAADRWEETIFATSVNVSTLNGTQVTAGTGNISTLNAPTGRGATYVIAASDAPAHVKAQADYIVTTNASDTIQTAYDALGLLGGGTLLLSSGNFNTDTMLELYQNNIDIEGAGSSTIVTKTGTEWAKPLFEVRGDNQSIRDIRFKFNINLGNAIAFAVDYRAQNIIFEDCFFAGPGSQVLFALSQNMPAGSGLIMSEYISFTNCVFDGLGMVGSPNLTTDWGRHIYYKRCSAINAPAGAAAFNVIGSIRTDGYGYSQDIVYEDVTVNGTWVNGIIAGNVLGLKIVRPYINGATGNGIALYNYDDGGTTRKGYDVEIRQPTILNCNVGINNRGFDRFKLIGGSVSNSTFNALIFNTSVDGEYNGVGYNITGVLVNGTHLTNNSQNGSGAAAAVLLVAGSNRILSDIVIRDAFISDNQTSKTQTLFLEYRQNSGAANIFNVNVGENVFDMGANWTFSSTTGTVVVRQIDPVIMPNRGIETIPYGLATSAVGYTANYSHYVPIILPYRALISTITIRVGTQSGGMDLGIYSSNGSRIVSTGNISCPAAGVQTIALGRNYYLTPGLYYLGIAADNNVATFYRVDIGIGSNQSIWQAAYPLPAIATMPNEAGEQYWIAIR